MFWPTYNTLRPDQRAALVALMEADNGPDLMRDATNVIHATHNRAQMLGWPVGRVLSYRKPGAPYGWYQPLWEPTQQARALSLMRRPEFGELTRISEARGRGEAESTVGDATHFVSKQIEDLARRQPLKYRTFREWATPENFRPVADSSHLFYRVGGPAPPITRPATLGDVGATPDTPPLPVGANPVPIQTTVQAPAPSIAPDDLTKMAGLQIGAQRTKLMADLLNKIAYQDQGPRSALEGISRAVAAVGGAYMGKASDDKALAQKEAMIRALGGSGLSPFEAMAYATGDADTTRLLLGKRMERETTAEQNAAEMQRLTYGKIHDRATQIILERLKALRPTEHENKIREFMRQGVDRETAELYASGAVKVKGDSPENAYLINELTGEMRVPKAGGGWGPWRKYDPSALPGAARTSAAPAATPAQPQQMLPGEPQVPPTAQPPIPVTEPQPAAPPRATKDAPEMIDLGGIWVRKEALNADAKKLPGVIEQINRFNDIEASG